MSVSDHPHWSKAGHAAVAAALSAVLGLGVGRATVPSSPSPKMERICVDAEGGAQIYLDDDGRKRQLLVPANHTLAVMHREGGKARDIVPPKLSAAIKSVLAEAGALANSSSK